MVPWAIVLLALITRAYGIEANGLRTDETYSLGMASRTIPDLYRTVVVEGHDATPPTFNLILHFIRLLSQELWFIRLVSVLSGVGLVWATFQLAKMLFGFKTAALSALLLAISPFAIEFSQVARAYSLSSLLAFLSVSYFARMRLSPHRRSLSWLYVITTLGALSTHYLTFLLVVFENLVVGVLVIVRRLSRHALWRWVRLQIVLALASLPLLWLALSRIPASAPGSGQTWLAEPSPLGMVRTLILWGIGDPSYGPTRFTVARLIGLLLIVAILLLGGVTVWKRWTDERDHREEILRVVFVGAAFVAPWFFALGISYFRRIFNEKYFLFQIPFLLMLLAWSVLRIRPAALSHFLLISLLGLTMLGLVIYYSSPAGEQWREAVAHVEQEKQRGDYVAVMPGFYIQPVSYYLHDAMVPTEYDVLHAPIAFSGPIGIEPAGFLEISNDLPQAAEVVSQASTLWLLTGYAEADPVGMAWFYENYAAIDELDFVGVRVIQWQKKQQ